MTPTVSIIVPLYNRAELVKETIQSVLDQSCQHWELIVVDDGSTDGSDEVVKAYAEEDDRIKVYYRHRDPKGASTCRNIGLEKSTGEYVIFLDSDDLLANWCLEERISYAETFNDKSFLIFRGALFHHKPFDTIYYWNVATGNWRRDLANFFSGNTPWQTSSVIWKASSLKVIDKWNEKALSWQDCDLHIKALVFFKDNYHVPDIEKPDFFIRRGVEEKMSSDYFSYQKTINRHELIFDLVNFVLCQISFEKSRIAVSARHLLLNEILLKFYRRESFSLRSLGFFFQISVTQCRWENASVLLFLLLLKPVSFLPNKIWTFCYFKCKNLLNSRLNYQEFTKCRLKFDTRKNNVANSII